MPKPKRPKPTRRDILGEILGTIGTVARTIGTIGTAVTALGPVFSLIFKKRATVTGTCAITQAALAMSGTLKLTVGTPVLVITPVQGLNSV